MVPPFSEYWYDVMAEPPLDEGARTTRSKPPTGDGQSLRDRRATGNLGRGSLAPAVTPIVTASIVWDS